MKSHHGGVWRSGRFTCMYLTSAEYKRLRGGLAVGLLSPHSLLQPFSLCALLCEPRADFCKLSNTSEVLPPSHLCWFLLESLKLQDL